MKIRLLLILNIGMIGILLSQSVVYRVNEKNLDDALSAGKDQLKDENHYWFVYTLELTNGPEINRNGNHVCISNNESNLENHKKENRISLNDLKGSSAVEKLKYKPTSGLDSQSVYYMIFEYSKDNLKEFEISQARDNFDFQGKEIIFAGNTEIKKSFLFVAEMFDNQNEDELKEDLMFPLYLHKELEGARTKLFEIAMSDDFPESAEQAVFWIGNIKSKESFETLKKIYKNSKIEDIREKVIFAYSNIATEEAIDLLIDIAKNDTNSEMRKKALFWIGQIASKRVLKTLTDIVEKDDDIEIKKSAVFALSQHENKEALEDLMRIAKQNPSRELRKSAIFWLSQSEDSKATEFLVDLVKE